MNTNVYNSYVRQELYHHGIQGQKWGKRNGPPYPLSPEDYSAAEKKARDYQDQLNDLAMKSDKATESALKNAAKADAIKEKLKKETSRNGQNSKYAKELNEKFEYFLSNTASSMEEQNKLDDEIDRISDQLVDEGFDLYEAHYNAYIEFGKDIAKNYLGSSSVDRNGRVNYTTRRFAVDVNAEEIAKAQKERKEKKSETTSEKIGSHEVEWDEDTGEIKSVKDEKGNKASFDDVLEEQDRKEHKSKSEKKPKVNIPSEDSSIMKRMRAKIEKGGLDSLTDSDWDALGWSEDIVGTDEEIELLNNLHVWEYY